MINVKIAYSAAKKISDSEYLKQILSFDKAFGFIFGKSKTEIDIGGLCILIDKTDPTISATIPIVIENLDFLNTGKEIPLTTIL